jgi:hypothetical protein
MVLRPQRRHHRRNRRIGHSPHRIAWSSINVNAGISDRI